MNRMSRAIVEQIKKVLTAFATWGLGVLIMAAYCIAVYWLNEDYGLYVMILGSLFFLTFTYFFIDLWWNYKRGGFRE